MTYILFRRAIADLFWSFFPLFLIAFVLAILGRLEHIAERSDLAICAAVLFGEGWWRVRKIDAARTPRLDLLGKVGAAAGVLMAALLLLSELRLTSKLILFVSSGAYIVAQMILLVFAIGYALVVRMRILDWEERAKPGASAPPRAQ